MKPRAGNSFAFGGANDGVTGAELLRSTVPRLAEPPPHGLSFTVASAGFINLYLMPQIPTPPASRPGSETPEAELKPAEASSELLASLDTLLEQYLHLIDQQQKLQSGLSKQLSSV